MSYLDFPRIHFSGCFQADPSTVNNDVRHFDVKNFKKSYQEFNPDDKCSNWNPQGTGIFRFVDCKVNSVCDLNENNVPTYNTDDKIVEMLIENDDQQPPAKIVDLDPQQQMVSQIWCMRPRLTDSQNQNFLIGNMATVAFMNLWLRRGDGSKGGNQHMGANYQSILEDLSWKLDNIDSPILKKLSQISQKQNNKLAIHFNLYGYGFGSDKSDPDHTLGYITGTIGPYYDESEPKHFVMGRQMIAAPKGGNPMIPANKVYGFQCKHHEKQNILTADFGNCLPTNETGDALLELGKIKLAVFKDNLKEQVLSVKESEVEILGDVNYGDYKDYKIRSGIQDFYYAKNPNNKEILKYINNCPLLLISKPGHDDENYTVFIQESLQGYYVRSDDHVYRLNPGDQSKIDFYVSQYGQPLQNQSIFLFILPENGEVNPMGGSGSSNDCKLPSNIPKIGKPNDNVISLSNGGQEGEIITYSFSNKIPIKSKIKTDKRGHAVLTITASEQGAGNPRGYIDGQLYGIGYSLDLNQKYNTPCTRSYWEFISVLAFDLTKIPSEPTWDNDIQPILTQYSNLYPIMSRYVVDLGNPDSIKKRLNIVRLAFSLPINDPNYMPVTRDLSENKRKIIINWLNKLV